MDPIWLLHWMSLVHVLLSLYLQPDDDFLDYTFNFLFHISDLIGFIPSDPLHSHTHTHLSSAYKNPISPFSFVILVPSPDILCSIHTLCFSILIRVCLIANSMIHNSTRKSKAVETSNHYRKELELAFKYQNIKPNC